MLKKMFSLIILPSSTIPKKKKKNLGLQKTQKFCPNYPRGRLSDKEKVVSSCESNK